MNDWGRPEWLILFGGVLLAAMPWIIRYHRWALRTTREARQAERDGGRSGTCARSGCTKPVGTGLAYCSSRHELDAEWNDAGY